MKVFPKRKSIVRASRPPTVSVAPILSGWYPRAKNYYYYPQSIIPLVDELSCTRPSYKYNSSINTLSSGWWLNDGLNERFFSTSTTYLPPLSHEQGTIAWREIVSNTKGLTADIYSDEIEILEYPDIPFFTTQTWFSKLSTRLEDQSLTPYTLDELNQPNTTFRVVFSSLQHTFDNDLFYNVRDTSIAEESELPTIKSLFPHPLSSLWLQNGVPIAGTSDIFTFIPSIDNSIIQFSITAQNYRGKASYTSRPSYVSQNGYKYAVNSAQETLIRTTNQPGGSASMNMFTVKNHTTKTYVRNPNLWCKGAASAEYGVSLPDLTHQFTGCAVYKTFSYESYGGVLITPRHVLYCNHAHPQAKGTWGPNLNQACDLRFVTTDNVMVSCTQLHQAGSATRDLAVGLLDRDMEALGMHISPIFAYQHSPVTWGIGTKYVNTITDFLQKTSLRTNGINIPWVAVSQGAGRVTSTIPPIPIGKYPQYNDIMLHIGPQPSAHPLSSFRYNVWDGDSGTPVFLIIDSTVYLAGIMTTQNFGFTVADTNTINQLITAADAKAIAMGRLSAQTGYTVSSFDLSAIPVPPVYNYNSSPYNIFYSGLPITYNSQNIVFTT